MKKRRNYKDEKKKRRINEVYSDYEHRISRQPGVVLHLSDTGNT